MIYLDYAAGTPVKYVPQYDNWINPNAGYATQEATLLQKCRDRIREALGFDSGLVVFVKNASEAADVLCRNFIETNIRAECSDREHDAVWHKVDDTQCREETIQNAYFCQLANQLTGEVNNLANIREVIGNQFLCVDLNAAIGKMDITKFIHFDGLGIDACFASGTKFYAPHGVGFMWISDRLAKLLCVGDNSKDEYGLIWGTPDLPSIVALTNAAEEAVNNGEWNEQVGVRLYEYMMEQFEERGIEAKDVLNMIPGDVWSHPNITSLYIPGVDSTALQSYLAEHCIYIGRGTSACSDESDYRVLMTYGLTQEQAEHVIRVSFGCRTRKCDIDTLIDYIKIFITQYT